MLNYVRAELYKATHRKYTYWTLLFLLAGIAIVGTLFAQTTLGNNGNPLSAALGFGFMVPVLTIGYYLSIITADVVFSEQYKTNTLKNEVSFGLPRARIYLGKLVATAIVSLVMLAIVVAVYALVCAVILPHVTTDAPSLMLVVYALATALPLWLGALGLILLMMFVVRNTTIASFISVGVLAGMGQICDVLMMFDFGAATAIAKFVSPLLLTTPLNIATDAWLQGATDFAPVIANTGTAWMVGMGWLLVTTVIGVFVFRKKDLS